MQIDSHARSTVMRVGGCNIEACLTWQDIEG